MTSLRTGLIVLALALGGGVVASAQTLAGQPAAAAPTISTQGFGPLRIGMTWPQARSAMPSLVQGDTEMFEGCYDATSPLYPGLYVMFHEGRLARVTASDNSQVRTVSGVGVGMTEAEVRAIIRSGLLQEAHHYEDPPAKYLTFWATDRQRGVRFEIGHNGRVSAIHGGDSAIEFAEGCA